MSKCRRCGKEYAEGFGYRFFCYDCQREFDDLVNELRVGFIADWNEDNVKEKPTENQE